MLPPTNFNIDAVTYGDLLGVDEEKIKFGDRIISECFRNGLIHKYFSLKPPLNSSSETRNELMFLAEMTKNSSEEKILFAKEADLNETGVYVKYCKEVMGIDIPHSFFDKLFDQTDPLLMFLKKHFNRPRPYQLAPYHGIELTFRVPTQAYHPAYPSGHALDAYIVQHTLSYFFPRHKSEIENICMKMVESRMVAGVHYPSDNKISKIIADDLSLAGMIKYNI